MHYLPFWQGSEEDVLDLLRTLRGSPANDLVAQRIAANANAFAAAWLDEEGQFRYWQVRRMCALAPSLCALRTSRRSLGPAGRQARDRACRRFSY